MPKSPSTVDQPQRFSEAKKFASDAAKLLSDTRCNNVVVLDVSGISPLTDFLVIATGTSPRQMKTACDEVEELAEGRNFKALSRAGDGGTNWTCIDLVDVVVHVFDVEARQFYDLESLWGDGQRVEWSPAGAPAR